jgi:hypothetical protein
VHRLLQLDAGEEDDAMIDFGPYGLGAQRTLAEFEAFIGVEPRTRALTERARLGGQQRLIEHSPGTAASYRSGAGSGLSGGSGGSGSVLQTDLVSAVRRQRGFMRQMLELEHAGAVTAEHLAAELEPYRAFLQRSADKELPVPGLLLDLVWHTHMLYPQRYASECRRIAGRLVDHDDDA